MSNKKIISVSAAVAALLGTSSTSAFVSPESSHSSERVADLEQSYSHENSRVAISAKVNEELHDFVLTRTAAGTFVAAHESHSSHGSHRSHSSHRSGS